MLFRSPAHTIKAIIEELLDLEGIEWAGTTGLLDPTPLEERVLEHLRIYWPYLHSNLVFDHHNIARALPELSPPRFDRDLLERLLNFALQDGWGRKPASPRRRGMACVKADAIAGNIWRTW